MHWTGKRVLVTGGTGFIGSFLVEALLERGALVRVPIRAQNFRSLSRHRSEIEWMEGDLRKTEYCQELVNNVDHVFHLASCRRTTEFHETKSSHVVTENVRMSLALIESLRDHPQTPATFFSTANVPGDFDIVTIAKRPNLDGYVMGKAVSEILWFAASKERGFPLLIVRPVGTYGPRDTFSVDGNVIPSLMEKAKKAPDKLIVWGNGEQKRAFLYVEDLVQAVLTLIENGAQGIQYVASPEVVTVRELAKSIRDLVRPDLPLAFDPTKPKGERATQKLPIHRSLKSFPWTTLGEGLYKTYEYSKQKGEETAARVRRTVQKVVKEERGYVRDF